MKRQELRPEHSAHTQGSVVDMARIPDRVSILRLRHLLEQQLSASQILTAVKATLTNKDLMLKQGTMVDATLIAAPRSTKNKDSECNPETHQTKRGANGTSA